MEFSFQPNFQRLTQLSSAASLWDREGIQEKMKKYFYKHDKLKSEEEWNEITKSVIQLLDPTLLSPSQYADLVFIIKDMGIKILDWFQFMKCSDMNFFFHANREKIYDDFMRQIYWTDYGSIDELKILKSSYINNPGIDPLVIHNLACLYCLEDEIPALWMKVPQKRQDLLEIIKRFQFTGIHGLYILGYWLAKEGHCTWENFNKAIAVAKVDQKEFLNADYSVEAKMFLICVRKGFKKAVEYFWENMSPDEREKTLPIALTQIMEIIGNKAWSKQYYRKEQFIEIIIFLMRKLDEYNLGKGIDEKLKYGFLFGTEPKDVEKNVDNFMDLFLEIWPWTECFTTAFNITKPYFNKENYDRLITSIIDHMKEDKKSDIPVKNDLYRRIFQVVWREMPGEFKRSIAYFRFGFLFKTWDTTIVKMILNDPFLAGKKSDSLVHDLLSYMTNATFENETEKIDPFLDEIFADVDLVKLNIFKYTVKDDFDSLKNLKNSIGKVEFDGFGRPEISDAFLFIQEVLRFLVVRNRFDLADKFLNWKFDDQSDIDKVKLDLSRGQFFRVHLYYNIWIRFDEEKAKQESNKFIKWLDKSQKDVKRSKSHYVEVVGEDLHYYDFDDKNEQRFYEPFVEADRCDMVIPLLKYSGMKQHYVNQFRRILIKDVRIWDYLENNETEKAEKFFKWAFNTQKDRSKHLHKLIHSKKGILSWKKFIAKVSSNDDLAEVFKNYINFWIKPARSLKKFKNNVISWKEKLESLSKEENDNGENDFDPCVAKIPIKEDREKTSNLDQIEIYCPEDKLHWFLTVLNSFESAGDDYESGNSTDSDRKAARENYLYRFLHD